MATSHILLFLTLVMPRDVPDKVYRFHMETMAECFTDAQDFMEHGVTKTYADEGAIAVMAGCLTNKPDDSGT